MDELVRMGVDDFGRDVFLAFTTHVTDLISIDSPTTPFVLFVGADATSLSADMLYSVAAAVLANGAAYVAWWGPGCDRAEQIFDEAAVGDGSATPLDVITTSHADESIFDALEFATKSAVLEGSQTTVVVFAGNVHWYNEAQNCLEDLLGANAG